MTKCVSITIHSTQRDADNTCETVTQTALGEYRMQNGKAYLSYDEKENGKVTLKIEPDEITMLRHGAYPTRLTFRKGEMYPGMYHTPYGKLNIATETHDFCVVDGSSVHIVYTLWMEENPLLHTTLRVSWEERNEI